ncbi:MAG: hypothetical protein AB9915_00275 [Candidatus Dojkabacteria bacterium]
MEEEDGIVNQETSERAIYVSILWWSLIGIGYIALLGFIVTPFIPGLQCVAMRFGRGTLTVMYILAGFVTITLILTRLLQSPPYKIGKYIPKEGSLPETLMIISPTLTSIILIACGLGAIIISIFEIFFNGLKFFIC